MEYKKINETTFLIRIKRGERIMAALLRFFQQNNIEGGFFYGIGAVDEAELAHYHVDTKKYSSKKFTEPLEMTNITGTAGICDKDTIIHAHAAFSNPKMEVIAGHLVEARVSGTAELYFTKTEKLEKKFDPETGLKLFSFSTQPL